MAQLLGNLNISKASFFGFSNGGNTVMQIGIRHPEIVNKLILASAFYKREGMVPGFFDAVLPGHAVAMSNLIKDSRLMILPATHGSYMGADDSDPGSKIIEMTAAVIEEFLNGI